MATSEPLLWKNTYEVNAYMNKPINKSNFFIFTGGPGSGKTSVLDELNKRGYFIVPEVAREIIKAQRAIAGKVKFTDCDFESCDLSLSKFPGCKFSEVSFKESKLAGINWTDLSWPLVKLSSPLYFYSSNISHSSFYGLELADLIVEDCKAHEVDFRESVLSHASFMGTDLHNSLFMHTNLKHADFTNAMNYSIDINFNTVTHASFSYPDVIALLNYLDIKIIGGPSDDGS